MRGKGREVAVAEFRLLTIASRRLRFPAFGVRFSGSLTGEKNTMERRLYNDV